MPAAAGSGTIIGLDGSDLRSIVDGPMRIECVEPSSGSARLITISSSELVINLADPLLGSTHSIRSGPSTIDLKSLPSSPMIVPDPAAAGMYAIVGPAAAQMDSTSVYQTYPAFEMALSSMLSGSGKVVRVLATGQFDATSNTFTAVQIAVVVH